MIKKLIPILAGALLLSACERGPGEYHGPQEKKFVLPDEMKHCHVYTIDDGYRGFNVVCCPKQPTTTTYTESCGKNCTKTVTTQVIHGE